MSPTASPLFRLNTSLSSFLPFAVGIICDYVFHLSFMNKNKFRILQLFLCYDFHLQVITFPLFRPQDLFYGSIVCNVMYNVEPNMREIFYINKVKEG
jgi:hypothetical protein